MTSRRGYVLLLTLLLIPLAAVALASIERLSLTRAMEASQAKQELQRRWLSISCQPLLLRRAPVILEKARLDPTVLHETVSAMVGECELELIFTDEQAKANVNTLWSTRDSEQCRASLERLVRDSPMPLALEPTPPELTGAGTAPFGTYSQVFRKLQPIDLLGPKGFRNGPARHVTLWGSGKLNFHGATREALREICSPVLGPADIEKLLSIRQSQPAIGMIRLLDLLELSKEKRAEVLRRLTDRSHCFGLWIVLKDSNGTWYRFAVGGDIVQSLEW